jgi:hypothetical protein
VTDQEAAGFVDSALLRSPPWRLRFEMFFLQENRIRVLEGKAAITRQQFRQGIVNYVKTFDPDAIDA